MSKKYIVELEDDEISKDGYIVLHANLRIGETVIGNQIKVETPFRVTPYDSYKEQFSNIFEVGDEVKDDEDEYKYIVTRDDGPYLQCIDSNGEVYEHILKSEITKTGRTFPWFKEMLKRFLYD